MLPGCVTREDAIIPGCVTREDAILPGCCDPLAL